MMKDSLDISIALDNNCAIEVLEAIIANCDVVAKVMAVKKADSVRA